MAGASNHPPPGPVSVGQPENVIPVLSISPFDADHAFFRHAFSRSHWQFHGVRSRREALDLLRERYVPVVICEETLPDCTWKEILTELASLQDAPLLIVTSRLADDSLWAEVLNLGGYDLLMKPFDRTEVVRVVSLAWRHWKNTWERLHARPEPPTIAAAG